MRKGSALGLASKLWKPSSSFRNSRSNPRSLSPANYQYIFRRFAQATSFSLLQEILILLISGELDMARSPLPTRDKSHAKEERTEHQVKDVISGV